MISGKNCFPCWKWLTQVEHSQQYNMYNVWFKHILHIYNDYSYRVLTFIRLFVDKNTQISGIDMRLQSNRPKVMNLHTSSIRLFWALTGPLAMSMGVSKSYDIEFIDIVDNNHWKIILWWTVVDKNLDFIHEMSKKKLSTHLALYNMDKQLEWFL